MVLRKGHSHTIVRTDVIEGVDGLWTQFWFRLVEYETVLCVNAKLCFISQ